MPRKFSHVVGFDDAPFEPRHRGDVMLVGAVFAGARLEGILSGKVRRDGRNATQTLIRLVSESRFGDHLQAVLTQGIAFAGFNVIDLFAVYKALGIPALALARKAPDVQAIKSALLEKVPGGRRKWRLLERLGPMEAIGGVYVQRVGISHAEAEALISAFAFNSRIPEPLRTAHLIAGGVTRGESRHRV